MKFVAIAILLFAFGQTAPGVSGKWHGSFQVKGNDGHIPQLFFLTQEGTKITGTGGPDASERYPIADGKIAGNHISFDLTNAFAKFTYDLTDSGGQMKGKLTIRGINITRTADVILTKSN